jgi:hypothetical protein
MSTDQGWACPAPCRVQHLFQEDGISVCRRYGLPKDYEDIALEPMGYMPACARCRNQKGKAQDPPKVSPPQPRSERTGRRQA